VILRDGRFRGHLREATSRTKIPMPHLNGAAFG
jgi:hypothetical protein